MKALVFGLFLMFGCSVQAYEMKIVTVESYSRPWLAIYSSVTTLKAPVRARLHLHGFTQDPKTGKAFKPEFDFDWVDDTKNPSEADLRKFSEAYGFQREVAFYPHHLVLIPLARGHCDQYPELYDIQKFDRTLGQVIQKLGIKESDFSLTMASAHSGGGDLLSKLMDQASTGKYFQKVTRSDFYDAIYSDESAARLKTWILNPAARELRLFSIPDQEPARRGADLFSKMAGKEKVSNPSSKDLKLEQKVKSFLPDSRIILIQEPAKTLNHWTILQKLWIF